MNIRKSTDRGYAHHGWLESYHSFSFADYFDKNFMGFKSLRVINEDIIEPHKGFGPHPHNDMEIVTYIISGELTHEDNTGNKEAIKEGEVQVMSAGSGIVHSEFNHSDTKTHLLQIWIKPNVSGGKPYYKIYKPDHYEKWALVATGDTQKDAISIKQDAEVYVINSLSLKEISLPENNKKDFWIQIATGSVTFDGEKLDAGDGASFEASQGKITFNSPSKLVLFGLK